MAERKESKGQQVKSFTYYVPLPGGLRDDFEKTTVKVYFQGRDSEFAAYMPDHIVQAVGQHPDLPTQFYQGKVRSKLADEIEPAYKAVCKLYEKIQKNALRKKVLLVDIKANHPRVNKHAIGMQPPEMPRFEDISFALNPALAFTYSVYWLVGDGLYRAYKRDKDSELEEMTYVCKAPGDDERPHAARSRFMIDWTEEREQLLESIHGGLVVLIERLWQLLSGDTATNVDRLIAGGGRLMLAAPEKTS